MRGRLGEREEPPHQDARRVGALERALGHERQRPGGVAAALLRALQHFARGAPRVGEDHQLEAAFEILERRERHRLAAPRARLAVGA